MQSSKLAAVVATLSLSTTAFSAPLAVYPVQTGPETERFLKGMPTVNLEREAGAVVVTPLPFDHGSASFGLAVYNKSSMAANFGNENIRATVNGQPVEVFTVKQLESKAKNRAMWSAIGIAVVAGAAAGIASTAHNTNTYRSTTHTPYGTYTHVASWRDNSPGIVGATAVSAVGAAGIIGIQNRLDFTLANLAQDIVQTTTIDPDGSYGGRIVLGKPKGSEPYDVVLTVNWNGADYPFTFRVTEAGKNMPAPFSAPSTALPVAATAAPAQPALRLEGSMVTVAAHPAPTSDRSAGQPAPKAHKLPHEDVIETVL